MPWLGVRVDAAVAPIVLALKRFGATFQDLPNLNAYKDKMEVRPLIGVSEVPELKS